MEDDELGSGSDVITPNVTCQLERVQLKSFEFILPTVTLGALNVAVIVGNSLVILAVFTSAKLRTTTNAFVCSLAVADLLVGLMVLPFSNANEVLRFWVFGPIWCSVWLAVDVWLCTASILNLVAISFDRYVAISRPFKYHNLLSPKRGKVLVGCVWILSFVICFPPLIGWNEQGKGLGNRFVDGNLPGGESAASGPPNATQMNNDVWSGSGLGNSDSSEILGFDPSAESLYIISTRILTVKNLSTTEPSANEPSATTAGMPPSACEGHFPECGLTSDPGYIVYSALGSFWIPAIIMCVFYWKIYRTAVKSTAALKIGMLKTKAGNDLSSSNTEPVTLRIHRGGGGVRSSTISDNGKRRSGMHGGSYAKCQYRTSFGRDSSTLSDSDIVFVNTHSANPSRNKKYRDPSYGRNGKQKDIRLSTSGPQPDYPLLGKHEDDGSECYYGPGCKQKKMKNRISLSSQQSLEPINGDRNDLNGVSDHHEAKTMAFLRKSRRKNFKLELQKLNKEKKAAKTVGVIVGCFILCWLPFFTVYLLGAFCPDCTPPLLFSIFFWLGYCNSAINPCVYALFSRDFRFAFKKLLRCNCHIEPRQKHQLGFVTKLHSFRMQASSRSNDSNSD